MSGIHKTVTIIGIGRVGGALALALSAKGFQVENLFARTDKNAIAVAAEMPHEPRIFRDEEYAQIGSDIVLISTQDSEIERVADKLAANLLSQTVLLHTSGSLSSEILKKSENFICGSIHPLVSISDAFAGSGKFRGAFFGIEGDPHAIEIAEAIAENLGGKSFLINSKAKPLYHASAVMACGHLVALLDAANEMLAKCGVDESQTQKILMPLVNSTIGNLESQTAEKALTGTFARLDTQTFARHLKAMKDNVSEEVLELYLQLGLRSLHLVKANDSNREKLEEMRKEISLAKRNLRC